VGFRVKFAVFIGLVLECMAENRLACAYILALAVHRTCRWYDHTCKSIWRCDNVGGLGEHVTHTHTHTHTLLVSIVTHVLRIN